LVVGADEIRALLAELQARPDDAELRRRAAEALDGDGRRDEVKAILAPLVNLTGHEDDGQLPCLCRRCLPHAGDSAASAGMEFERSFVVVGRRVMHFWMLRELGADRIGVRASVAAALAARLAAVQASRR
jgi:hypothetical protein